MTDEMTAERLAEIREGLSDFDRRRLETSMSGGVDTPGRVTYHFGPSPDGLPRYSIVVMLPEIAAELMAEIDRLREHCADLILSLTYSDHELEEHMVPEVERLRARNADLSMRLDMAVHEMEEHVVPERDRLREEIERQAADELTRMRYHDEEVARLREQVKTLQAERDAMTVWYRVWLRGGGIYYAENERDARECLSSKGGYLESRLCSTWLPVTEEGPAP